MAYPALKLENEAISPSKEMGAFEALWANGTVASFKQLYEIIQSNNPDNLSELVTDKEAASYYHQAIALLKKANISSFGIRFKSTVDYPKSLLDVEYPLPLLYYQGDWDLVYTPSVAVVGTRNPSDDGIKRTRLLIKHLVKQEFTIFSGLAAGIDTAAHKAAIEYGGKTVAVIGVPLWMTYPKENAALQAEIAEKHLLISQVPMVVYQPNNIAFTRQFFPERNKIMSALSQATIIVEAGETSGTLIQARAAIKQGRKVFILNNNFENPALSWPAKLEKAGALRVREVEEIIQGLKSV